MNLFSMQLNLSLATLVLASLLGSPSTAAPAKTYVTQVDLSRCTPNQDYRDGNAGCEGGYKGRYNVTVSLIDFSRAYPAADVSNTSYQGGDIDTETTSTLNCQFTYRFPVASVSMQVEDQATGEILQSAPQILTATKVINAGTLSWVGHKKEDCIEPKLTGVTDLEVSSQTAKPIPLLTSGKDTNLRLYLTLDNYKISGSIIAPKIEPEAEVLASYNINDQTPTLSWTAVAVSADRNGDGKFISSNYRTQGRVFLSPKN